jgi:hypothetical protein
MIQTSISETYSVCMKVTPPRINLYKPLNLRTTHNDPLVLTATFPTPWSRRGPSSTPRSQENKTSRTPFSWEWTVTFSLILTVKRYVSIELAANDHLLLSLKHETSRRNTRVTNYVFLGLRVKCHAFFGFIMKVHVLLYIKEWHFRQRSMSGWNLTHSFIWDGNFT